jgi:hypothetical protein
MTTAFEDHYDTSQSRSSVLTITDGIPASMQRTLSDAGGGAPGLTVNNQSELAWRSAQGAGLTATCLYDTFSSPSNVSPLGNLVLAFTVTTFTNWVAASVQITVTPTYVGTDLGGVVIPITSTGTFTGTVPSAVDSVISALQFTVSGTRAGMSAQLEIDLVQAPVACIGADTPVDTPGGSVPAGSLRVGDLVLTRAYSVVGRGPAALASGLDLDPDSESPKVVALPVAKVERSALPHGSQVVKFQRGTVWGVRALHGDALLTRPHTIHDDDRGAHVEAGWYPRNGQSGALLVPYSGIVVSLTFETEVAFSVAGGIWAHAQSPFLRPPGREARARGRDTNFILEDDGLPWTMEDGRRFRSNGFGCWEPHDPAHAHS